MNIWKLVLLKLIDLLCSRLHCAFCAPVLPPKLLAFAAVPLPRSLTRSLTNIKRKKEETKTQKRHTRTHRYRYRYGYTYINIHVCLSARCVGSLAGVPAGVGLCRHTISRCKGPARHSIDLLATYGKPRRRWNYDCMSSEAWMGHNGKFFAQSTNWIARARYYIEKNQLGLCGIRRIKSAMKGIKRQLSKRIINRNQHVTAADSLQTYLWLLKQYNSYNS